MAGRVGARELVVAPAGEAARRTVSVRRSPHVGNTLFWGGGLYMY